MHMSTQHTHTDFHYALSVKLTPEPLSLSFRLRPQDPKP